MNAIQCLASWLLAPRLLRPVPEVPKGTFCPIFLRLLTKREPGPQAPIDEEVQTQVERLIARAAKVGAWGQAEEYCRSRFKGPQLAYALEELRVAKDEAQSKKTERKAA